MNYCLQSEVRTLSTNGDALVEVGQVPGREAGKDKAGAELVEKPPRFTGK